MRIKTSNVNQEPIQVFCVEQVSQARDYSAAAEYVLKRWRDRYLAWFNNRH